MFSWAPKDELAVISAASSKLILERLFWYRLWPEVHRHFSSLTSSCTKWPCRQLVLGGKRLWSQLRDRKTTSRFEYALHIILYIRPSVNLILGLLQPTEMTKKEKKLSNPYNKGI